MGSSEPTWTGHVCRQAPPLQHEHCGAVLGETGLWRHYSSLGGYRTHGYSAQPWRRTTRLSPIRRSAPERHPLPARVQQQPPSARRKIATGWIPDVRTPLAAQITSIRARGNGHRARRRERPWWCARSARTPATCDAGPARRVRDAHASEGIWQALRRLLVTGDGAGRAGAASTRPCVHPCHPCNRRSAR